MDIGATSPLRLTERKWSSCPQGGDTIQWRPDGPTDPHYCHRRGAAGREPPESAQPGRYPEPWGTPRRVTFIEDVDLSGMPDALQNIAHNPGNKLSTLRLATFVLINGAWTLQSIV